MDFQFERMYLSYEQISMHIDSRVEAIKKRSYDAIVYIGKSGMFPAQHLSHRTKLPIHFLQTDGRRNQTSSTWLGEAPSTGGKLLLVHDTADSGDELARCQSFLIKQGYLVNTFVIYQELYYDYAPDFCCFGVEPVHTMFVLPWRKSTFSPTAQKKRQKVSEFTAWDYSCVHSYRTIVEASGSIEVSDTPTIKENDIFLLTKESKQDRELSKWLRAREVKPQVHRRVISNKRMSDYTIALWKVQKIKELGCSRYVENNAEQALVLSQQLPFVEILWWNDGSPIVLKSTSFSI